MRIFFRIVLILSVIAMLYFVSSLLIGGSDSVDNSDNTQTTLPGDQVITPVADSSDSKQSLVTNSGRALVVNKFSQVKGVKDVGSKMYHLQGDDYSIIFNESNSSFAINLSKQPILSTRDSAVNNLAMLLGVDPVQLCDLNIYISTTKDFDPVTAGQNLGLGVCFN